MPWDKSLDLVLGSCGLELRRSGAVLRVLKAAQGPRTTPLAFVAGALSAAAAIAVALGFRWRLRWREKQTLLDSRFSMGEEDVDRIVRALDELFSVQKVYRDPDLDLQSLAGRLNVPSHVLSWIFNAKIGSTFSDFANRHRVREIQEVLADPSARGRTVLDVALDAGYNTKSPFYRAFRKITGAAPGDVRRRNTP